VARSSSGSYLGEINDSQLAGWSWAIEAFDEDAQRYRQLSLFPASKPLPQDAMAMACKCGLRRCSCIGRGNGARAGWPANCISSCLDAFWSDHFAASRKGQDWQKILQTLVSSVGAW
jgi:hypothetical protein